MNKEDPSLKAMMSLQTSTFKYRCPECSKVLRSQISFHVHIRTHSSASGLLVCELCGEYSTREAESLRRHLKQSHVNNGPYFCEICEREFFGGTEVFKNHLKLHAEDKGFPCGTCGKAFINKGRRNSHVAAVHGQKSFQCEVCSSFFGTKFSLQRHALKHNKDSAKIFACGSCSYQTPILSNLTKHVQEVHGEFSWRGGEVFRPARKILTVSSISNHREIMGKKSQEITERYFKDFSMRMGQETDAEALKRQNEELDRVVDALLQSPG